ncbi:MAG: hypothetical protein HY824_06855 [Acidobacteria bacterium]|nr:hypothetical protein [Acidobacteriota bacterium]
MTRRPIAWLAIPALLLTAGAAPGGARDVVEIVLYRQYFPAPATVRFMVAVQPNADNRMLRIEADSTDMFRSSEVSLSGAGEKRLHSFTYTGLPAGSYTLRAQVYSTRDLRGTATSTLTVTGTGVR